MFQPVKAAFGAFMAQFYASVVPTTRPLSEYVTRGLTLSVVRAPGRLVDQAEEMLLLLQRHDADGTPSHPPALPVIIFALAKDAIPSGRDYTRQIADAVQVTIPDDDLERAFGLRTVAADIRAQVAIFSNDEPSARSLAAQFLLFLDATAGRRFSAVYPFAGMDTSWPVQIESPEAPAMAIANDAKNLTIMAIDLTLKATIPLFDSPVDADGVPTGYPVVEVVDTTGTIDDR